MPRGDGLASWLVDAIRDLANFVSKDGKGGAIIAPPLEELARSAAYSHLASSAQGIIKTMSPADAKAVRQLINNGEDFTTEAFSKAWAAMDEGDEAAKKIADSFIDTVEKFVNADSNAVSNPANAVGEYAEFLGRKDGRLGLMHSLDGYFNDAQHGMTRVQTIAGVTAGVGIVGRVLSGGSLTRTNTGERDIAGVPFI